MHRKEKEPYPVKDTALLGEPLSPFSDRDFVLLIDLSAVDNNDLRGAIDVGLEGIT